MWSFSEIQELIKHESLFRSDQFAGVDYDTLLDVRDKSPFCSQWSEAEREVSAAWKQLPVEMAHRVEITVVRERM